MYSATAARSQLTKEWIARTTVMSDGKQFPVFATGDMAKELSAIDKGSTVVIVGDLESVEWDVARGKKTQQAMQIHAREIRVCQTPRRSFGGSATKTPRK